MYRNLHYRLLNLWPFGLWIIAVFVAVALSGSRSWRSSFVGVYDCDRSIVAPSESGRIGRIDAIVGEEVLAGQLLVQMETARVDAEIVDSANEKALNTAGHELERSEWLQERHNELLQEELKLSSDKAELGVLIEELGRIEGLITRKLIDRDRYAELDARAQRLKASVRAGVAIVYTLESEIEKENAESGIIPIGDVESLLRIRKAEMSLHVVQGGIVARIGKQVGDFVHLGEEIAEILHEQTAKVVGFLPVEYANQIQVGQEVEVYSSRSGIERMKGWVRSVSPSASFSMESGRSQLGAGRSGLQFSVELDSNDGFILGEPVTIKIKNRTWLDSVAALMNKEGTIE